MNVRGLSRLVPAVLLVALGCRSASDRGLDVVHPAVRDALRAHGQVEVIVMLRLTDADMAPPADRGALRGAIAELQRGVIQHVDSADFRPRRLFDLVPAIAGTLRSRRGLEALANHPAVVRIGLDAEGGGTPNR